MASRSQPRDAGPTAGPGPRRGARRKRRAIAAAATAVLPALLASSNSRPGPAAAFAFAPHPARTGLPPRPRPRPRPSALRASMSSSALGDGGGGGGGGGGGDGPSVPSGSLPFDTESLSEGIREGFRQDAVDADDVAVERAERLRLERSSGTAVAAAAAAGSGSVASAAAAAAAAAAPMSVYEITLPLPSSEGSKAKAAAAAMVGLTLRQVSREGTLSPSALRYDQLSLRQSLPPEEEVCPVQGLGGGGEGTGGAVELLPEVASDAPASCLLPLAAGGVVVSSVVRGGAAWNMGVRPGDVVSATSATVGKVRFASCSCFGGMCVCVCVCV